MSISRKVARPLIGAMFVVGGFDAAKDPAAKVSQAVKVTDRLPIDRDAETLVRLNGIAQVAAGGLLSLGVVPRLASLVLIGSLVPTTAAGHRFWEEDDEGDRASQQVHLLKNLAMLGGLILAAADTDGRPSVGWRARRALERIESRAASVAPGSR